MAEAQTNKDDLAALQQQLTALNSALASQQQVLASQVALQAAQTTRTALLERAVLDNLRAQISAQAALDKAQAAAPFAELQGLKEGLSSVAVPGKEGTLSIGKGGDGALMLRVKAEWLRALSQLAKELLQALPESPQAYVLASEADLAAAYRAEVWLRRIDQQQRTLGLALAHTGAAAAGGTPVPADVGLAGGLALAQTVPVVLNALSDAGKFFRTDRSISLFETGPEAQRLFESLLEQHALGATRSVQRLDLVSPQIVPQAEQLLGKLSALAQLRHRAHQRLGSLQRRLEAQAKAPGADDGSPMPSPEDIGLLRDQAAEAGTVLDALDPGKSPETFWAQVLGQAKSRQLQGRARIHANVVAQAVQVLEKRAWRADRLLGAGEIQVDYRVVGADGRLLLADVVLHVSARRDAFETADAQQWRSSQP